MRIKIKNIPNKSNQYHAHGGPVVSNVNQDFDLYAQNRGGMMMAQGGNMYFGGGGVDPNIIGPIDYSFHMPTGSDVIEDLPGFTFDPSVTNKVSNNALGLNNPNFAFVNPAVYNNEISEIQDLPGYTPSVSVSDEAIGLNQNYSSVFNPDLPKLDFTQSDVKKYGLDPNNVNVIPDPKSTTPWSEEPWYSKAARYGQAIPGVIASITALQNKKRKLTPERISPNRIDLERSRITTKEEGRRALDAGLRTIRGGSGSTGQLAANTRDAILNYNKNMGANIAKLYETEENANAQLAQQAALANQQYGNAFKQLNEEMFQNAQTQAIAGLQDTTGKLAGAAGEERKQYLQEWIAKNKLKTRDFIQGPDGSYYYEGPDGTLTKV